MSSRSELEREIADAIADKRMSIEDADAVREFWAFLADPDVGPADVKAPLSMDVLRRHQHALGLTDADLAQAARNRGVTS